MSAENGPDSERFATFVPSGIRVLEEGEKTYIDGAFVASDIETALNATASLQNSLPEGSSTTLGEPRVVEVELPRSGWRIGPPSRRSGSFPPDSPGIRLWKEDEEPQKRYDA